MREYVVLPIQDEQGTITGRSLKIDTRYFLGEAADLANRYIDVVDARELVREEKEMIDRIISGLPPRPVFEEFEIPFNSNYYAPYVPTNPPDHDWRKIPGFSRYTMNPSRKIIEDATDREVPVTLGRLNNVLLSNDNGIMKRMSVNHLFNKTFPELAQPGL